MYPFSFPADICVDRLNPAGMAWTYASERSSCWLCAVEEALPRGHSMHTNPAENRKIGPNSGVKYHFIWVKYMNRDFVTTYYA